MDCSLPGSSVHGIFQARVLEWVAISFSRGDLPDPGFEPRSPALQADALPSEIILLATSLTWANILLFLETEQASFPGLDWCVVDTVWQGALR